MEKEPGFIYVLFNPSIPNLVKIGKTSREPEERAKELSAATGIPTPFGVVYQAFFQDITKAEEFIFNFLNDKKVSDSKEFFRSSTTEAINAVIQADKYFNKIQIETENVHPNKDDILLSETKNPPKEIWVEILKQADAYYYGWGDDIFQDFEEALDLYKQAATLGSVQAFHKLGDMYNNGEGVKSDPKQALKYYNEAANRGDDICWGAMAVIYFEINEYANADKCWIKFIHSPSFPSFEGLGNISGFYYLKFLEYMYTTNSWPHNNELKRYYQLMIKDKSEEEIKHLVSKARKWVIDLFL